VLLPFVFGDRYSGSVHTLELLAATPVFSFQIYLFWYVILGAGQERRALGVFTAGLVLNVALNVALIPSYGPEGAAVSWITAEAVVALLLGLLVHRYVFLIPFWNLVGRPLLVASIVVPIAVLVGLGNPLLGAAGGAIGCFVALVGSGYVRRDELAPLALAGRSGIWLVRRRGS
jgi:O-antigen/teichoic acid export membrane protein